MKPINPTPAHFQNPQGMLRWAQSVFQALSNKITLAEGNLQDHNGIYTTFNVDNGSGIMVRVGAAGSGLKYVWNAGTGQVTIDHALGRQPIGFLVNDLDANAVIWRVSPPTKQLMVLQTSNTAVNATIYIN